MGSAVSPPRRGGRQHPLEVWQVSSIVLRGVRVNVAHDDKCASLIVGIACQVIVMSSMSSRFGCLTSTFAGFGGTAGWLLDQAATSTG